MQVRDPVADDVVHHVFRLRLPQLRVPQPDHLHLRPQVNSATSLRACYAIFLRACYVMSATSLRTCYTMRAVRRLVLTWPRVRSVVATTPGESYGRRRQATSCSACSLPKAPAALVQGLGCRLPGVK
eukprot:1796903-Rhodomonas_salina.2